MSVFISLDQSEKLHGWNVLTNNVHVLLAVTEKRVKEKNQPSAPLPTTTLFSQLRWFCVLFTCLVTIACSHAM